MGFKPRSSFKSWTFVALDPFEDLLLGPTFGAAKVFIFRRKSFFLASGVDSRRATCKRERLFSIKKKTTVNRKLHECVSCVDLVLTPRKVL